jgi:hypothetical protein
MSGKPATLEIQRLRAEIAELGSAIMQLRRSGLDSATAQLLITRKRAALEWMMNGGREREPPTVGSAS